MFGGDGARVFSGFWLGGFVTAEAIALGTSNVTRHRMVCMHCRLGRRASIRNRPAKAAHNNGVCFGMGSGSSNGSSLLR